jgi:hypothetical protein
MSKDRRRQVIAIGGGAAAFGLLVAWMVPSTVPVKQASPLSALSAQAEAQRPTFSPVPASAIPASVVALPQPVGSLSADPRMAAPPPSRPGASPRASVQPDAASAAPDEAPVQVARQDDSLPPVIDAPPPPALRPAPAPPPAAPDYASVRAAWRAKMEAYARQAGNDD